MISKIVSHRWNVCWTQYVWIGRNLTTMVSIGLSVGDVWESWRFLTINLHCQWAHCTCIHPQTLIFLWNGHCYFGCFWTLEIIDIEISKDFNATNTTIMSTVHVYHCVVHWVCHFNENKSQSCLTTRSTDCIFHNHTGILNWNMNQSNQACIKYGFTLMCCFS